MSFSPRNAAIIVEHNENERHADTREERQLFAWRVEGPMGLCLGRDLRVPCFGMSEQVSGMAALACALERTCVLVRISVAVRIMSVWAAVMIFTAFIDRMMTSVLQVLIRICASLHHQIADCYFHSQVARWL